MQVFRAQAAQSYPPKADHYSFSQTSDYKPPNKAVHTERLTPRHWRWFSKLFGVAEFKQTHKTCLIVLNLPREKLEVNPIAQSRLLELMNKRDGADIRN